MGQNNRSGDSGNPKMEPIAVVGMANLWPGATDTQTFWLNIFTGKESLTEIPIDHWDTSEFFHPKPGVAAKTCSRKGGLIPTVHFDPVEFGIPPDVLKQTDSSQILGLLVAKHALEDAVGGDWSKINKDRVSVIVGSSGTTVRANEGSLPHHFSRIAQAMRDLGIGQDKVDQIWDQLLNYYIPPKESTFPGSLMGIVAGRIANRLDLHGSNFTVDAACASAISALKIAANELQLRQADLVVAGGASAQIGSPIPHLAFNQVFAISTREKCSPFDEDSDGMMVAEGIGMFILKRLADAEAQGDKIYAVIRGIGSSSDGRAKSIYAPSVEGQVLALRRAYEAAGYGPDSVELVEAHGTGTKAGDEAEIQSLNQVYQSSGRTDPQWCAIGSIKSQIGHPSGAAGAASLGKAILSLHHKILPPTINVKKPFKVIDFAKSPFYINTQVRPWIHREDHPRRAAISSFGFGGTNFHVTLEEYRGPNPVPQRFDRNPKELFLFSGKTPQELLTMGEQFLRDGEQASSLARRAWESQQKFSNEDPRRAGILAENFEDLTQKMEQLSRSMASQPEANLSLPTGVYYFPRFQKRKLAFLFPGQGSQALQMGGDLAMRFDGVRETWDRMDRVQFNGSPRLSEVLFPRPTFTPEEAVANSARLKATEWSQPALGATCAAMLALVEKLGLQADMTGGHSAGEITALYYAGVFSLEDFLRSMRCRGELMAKASGKSGGMIAVAGTLERIRELISQWQTSLVIANHNSPQQIVLSGEIDELGRIQTKLESAGLKVSRLNVSTAFHSPLVREAITPYRQFLNGLEARSPRLAVYSNTTAAPYPTDPEKIRELISEHMGKTVRFADEIQAMYQEGANLFLEIGPGSVLTRLVHDCLEGQDHLAISVDRKGKDGVESMLHAVAQLATAGVPLDFSVFDTRETLLSENAKKPSPIAVPVDSSIYGKKPLPPRQGNSQGASLNPVQTFDSRSPDSKSSNVTLLENNMSQEKDVKVQEAPIPMAVGYQGPEIATPASQTPTSPQSPMEFSATPNPGPETATEVPQGPEQEQLLNKLLQVIAEKTGYPLEILKPEMSLEADLGIDSIKQIEIVSAFTNTDNLMDLESQFSDIPLEEVSNILTIQDMGDFMLRHSAKLAGVMDQVMGTVQGDPTPAKTPEAERAPAAPQEPPREFSSPVTMEPTAEPKEEWIPPIASEAPPPSQVFSESTPPPQTPVPQGDVPDPKELQARLLNVIADKTGYPLEILKPEMSLEADLGIDSIKQIEIVSAFTNTDNLMDLESQFSDIPLEEVSNILTIQDMVDFMVRHAAKLSGVLEKIPGGTPDPQPAPTAPSGPSELIQKPTPVVETKIPPAPPKVADPIPQTVPGGAEQGLRLEIPKPGQLESLCLKPFNRERPGPGEVEVEVKAAGMNFLDYIRARGINPGLKGAVDLGFECTGKISAVGPGVENVQVGSEVVAFGTPTFSTHLKTLAPMVIPKPKNFSFEETATIPVTFLTAHYALNHLGRLSKGERVLIHAASGGVGLAAVQLAKHARAEIFATAGNPERREYLKSLGIQYVMDSRTLDYGDEILKITHGEGVDVVLNCLPKENIKKSISVLKKFGRFLEIGKTDIYRNNHLELFPFHKNLAYFAIDLGLMMQEKPVLAQSLYLELMKLFENGVLKPLPYRAFTLPEAEQAFRFMSERKHIGKIVITTDNPIPVAATSRTSPSIQAESPLHRYVLGTQGYTHRSKVKLAPGRDILIIPDDQGIAEEVSKSLNSMGCSTRIVSDLRHLENGSPFAGVIYLGGLRSLFNMPAALKVNKEAFRVAKGSAARIKEAIQAGGGWFITVQDTGGKLGLVGTDPITAVRGGLSGLAKVVAKEWEGVYSKAIDIQTKGQSPADIASALVQEILSGGEAIEVGLGATGERITASLNELKPEAMSQAPRIDENSVIVASGGARGVTAACLIELAKQCRPKIVLFGRSTIVDEESPELTQAHDEAALKKVLFAQAEREGIKLSPKQLTDKSRMILNSREVKATLEALRAAGSPVKYYGVDIMESRLMRTEGPSWIWTAGSLVRVALNEVRSEWGPISGVVHGAGVIMDRLIQDKLPEQFDLVYDTKVRGLLELLSALEGDPLKVLCLFSSVSARFGNRGQCDYAMANEVMNKIAQAERHRRGPDCLIKSINWGAWEGGMMNSILQREYKKRGGTLIPLETGAKAFVDEIQRGKLENVEVVITGKGI